MTAANDRMKQIGCYESKQMPIEQIIANTAAAAQTQTYAVTSPIGTAFI